MNRLIFIYAAGLMVLLWLSYEAYSSIRPAVHAAMVSAVAVCLYLSCMKKTPDRMVIGSKALAIAVTVPLLAWSVGNLWLLMIILGILIPFIAREREYYVPVYLFGLLLLPGLESSLVIGPLKLVDISTYDAMGIGTAIAIARLKGRNAPPRDLDYAAYAVVILLAVAVARGNSPSHFVRTIANSVIDIGLPYYIVSRGLGSIEEIRKAMVWLGMAAIVLGFIVTYEVVKDWVIYNELYTIYELPTKLNVKYRAGSLRAGGPFTEPTSMAMVIGQCMLAMWNSRDYFRTKALYVCMIVVGLYGMSMPQSRGAWIGLFLALLVTDLFRGRSSHLWVKIVAIGMAGSAVLVAAQYSPEMSQSMGLSSGDASESSAYRQLLWERGTQEVMKSPLLGYSSNDLDIHLADLRQGEGIIDYVNTYLWVALISGIGGLALFIYTFCRFLLRIWRANGSGPEIEGGQYVAAFVFATLVMNMEMFFFTSFGTRCALFVFVLYGMGAAYVRESRNARDAEEEEEAETLSEPEATPLPA